MLNSLWKGSWQLPLNNDQSLCHKMEADIAANWLIRVVNTWLVDKGVQQGCILSSCLFNLHDEFAVFPCSVQNIVVCYLVTQLCLTLWDPMDYSPPGSSVYGDFSGKNTGVGCHFLLWGSAWPRDWMHVSSLTGGLVTTVPPGSLAFVLVLLIFSLQSPCMTSPIS